MSRAGDQCTHAEVAASRSLCLLQPHPPNLPVHSALQFPSSAKRSPRTDRRTDGFNIATARAMECPAFLGQWIQSIHLMRGVSNGSR